MASPGVVVLKACIFLSVLLISCGSWKSTSSPPVSVNHVYLYTAYELCGDPGDCPLKEDDFRFAGTVNSNLGKIWYWSFRDPTTNESLWVWCEPGKQGYSLAGFLDREPKLGSTITIEDVPMAPLTQAVFRQDLKMVLDLLEQGHDPNVSGSQGSPLLWCILKDSNEIATLLLGHGADVNKILFEETKATPLILAVQHNNKTLVRRFIEHGADQNCLDSSGRTARQIAEQLGHSDLYDLLEDHQSQSAERTLTIAAQKNDTRTISTLLRDGVPVHGAIIGGLDSLMWSAAKANLESMGLLIDAGADIYRVNDQGLDAFDWANMEGQLEVLKVLQSVDKNLQNRYQNIDIEITLEDKHRAYSKGS